VQDAEDAIGCELLRCGFADTAGHAGDECAGSRGS